MASLPVTTVQLSNTVKLLFIYVMVFCKTSSLFKNASPSQRMQFHETQVWFTFKTSLRGNKDYLSDIRNSQNAKTTLVILYTPH